MGAPHFWVTCLLSSTKVQEQEYDAKEQQVVATSGSRSKNKDALTLGMGWVPAAEAGLVLYPALRLLLTVGLRRSTLPLLVQLINTCSLLYLSSRNGLRSIFPDGQLAVGTAYTLQVPSLLLAIIQPGPGNSSDSVRMGAEVCASSSWVVLVITCSLIAQLLIGRQRPGWSAGKHQVLSYTGILACLAAAGGSLGAALAGSVGLGVAWQRQVLHHSLTCGCAALVLHGLPRAISWAARASVALVGALGLSACLAIQTLGLSNWLLLGQTLLQALTPRAQGHTPAVKGSVGTDPAEGHEPHLFWSESDAVVVAVLQIATLAFWAAACVMWLCSFKSTVKAGWADRGLGAGLLAVLPLMLALLLDRAGWVLAVFIPGAADDNVAAPRLASTALHAAQSMSGRWGHGDDRWLGYAKALTRAAAPLAGVSNPGVQGGHTLLRRFGILSYWALTIATALVVQHWLVAAKNRRGPPLTVVRKGYHILALALFIPAMAWDPSMLAVSLAVAFALLLALETVRSTRVVPAVARALEAFMSQFTDERDDSALYFTHLALLAGMAAPVWLASIAARPLPSPMCMQPPSSSTMELGPTPLDATLPLLSSPATIVACSASATRTLHAQWWVIATAGMVSLGVGDTAAAVAGRLLGRHRLSASGCKTWEGLAAAVACMLAATLAVFAYVDAWAVLGWRVCAEAAAHMVGVAVLEAVTKELDNLVLPLWYTTCLLLVLRPNASLVQQA